MIWSCIVASGPGQLAIIEWKMNSQVYQDNVRVDGHQLKLSRGWVMQQDSVPKQRSKYNKELLKT